MTLTIQETTQQLHRALRDYIEATYHVSHRSLVQQRGALLDEVGVIHQRPYLESTPRYQAGKKFEDLGLPDAAFELFTAVTDSSGGDVLIHDPPYQHQAISAQASLVEGRSLVVMTGTGSGKTECFLLPILGKLAVEAKKNREAFGETPAVRALVLYPMNALVNDQLGRLRLLFGDARVVDRFVDWSGRPARFARYTSRTLYPGVRSKTKDQTRLQPIGKYFVDILKVASDPNDPGHEDAKRRVAELKKRGKWPAKPDLLAWYGSGNWLDRSGSFRRCVTLPRDPELLTRHEVHAAPPDVLVTNYSMLEYMLMRPLERPIFDRTREWLARNPDERFLLVVDEAHLYRGAQGAEVALLIRRLCARLGIPPERLQVICTSASFKDADYAVDFGAQLTGKVRQDFRSVRGELLDRAGAAKGTAADAAALAAVDMPTFYEAVDDEARLEAVAGFLEYRGIARPWGLQTSLYAALESFGPMASLVNSTMREAQSVDELGVKLFEVGIPEDMTARAITNLIALGSVARRTPNEPGLLPCRIHAFFRGLAGLWVCMDPDCTALPHALRGGPTGKMYSQPRDACECGARVLELYTCRNCGTAHARAYTDDVDDPGFLWAEAGSAFLTASEDFVKELLPIDLLLEKPLFDELAVPAEYDLVTGRLNPHRLGSRNRQVFIRNRRAQAVTDDEDQKPITGEFRPCAVCEGTAPYGRSTVQDHLTKGDQPFQALIAKQIQVQPPSPMPATKRAPLRGRKVLVFSDSRQMAARLAPNLQNYSTQDAIRPLIVAGYRRLLASPVAPDLALDYLYCAVLVAAEQLGVRLRPELKEGESFQGQLDVETAIASGVLSDPKALNRLWRGLERPPESLLTSIVDALLDRYYGLEALALGSLREIDHHTTWIEALPDIPGFAVTPQEKLATARLWIRCWSHGGLWMTQMPPAWRRSSARFKPRSGKFRAMDRFLGEKVARAAFEKAWLPGLLGRFAESVAPKTYFLKAGELTLDIEGPWAYCESCKTTQRPFPNRPTCVNCGLPNAKVIDPNADPVFVARKGYYRASTVLALGDPPQYPMALIAAEHTAQLNTAQESEVFSKAEEHELLFQDVNLGQDGTGRDRPAIDVLSCTTTMEVGIDIGSLSGVALRTMPPARANYQQRAGRAGRRGNAVATVTAFGSADSHDEHYFTNPEAMIRGAVDDPLLTLDNREIIQRHVTAFLLQRYHQDRLPAIEPADQPVLFEVLGTVAAFRNASARLNRSDFHGWLMNNESALRAEIDAWVPWQLAEESRAQLLGGFVTATMDVIDKALDEALVEGEVKQPAKEAAMGGDASGEANVLGAETPDEEEEEKPGRSPASENLLDRLLYRGVLPRYAFPTDVATFHVFDTLKSKASRPSFRYTPSQGLSKALSQYAPGKEVWIDSKLWTSGAIYSPMRGDRYQAWNLRRLYYECSVCHYAKTVPLDAGTRGESIDCEACGGVSTLGPAAQWLRPPGFAHPFDKQEGTTPEDMPAKSYATRAKLTAPTPSDPSKWLQLNDRLWVHHMRDHLLVTNRGPRNEGYTYCTKCGLIEPTASLQSVVKKGHRKPFPDVGNTCSGGGVTEGMVLGTDFITDVLLVTIRVPKPLTLMPGVLATEVALRTICEALTKAACNRLELEASELQAEFRPALTPGGREGLEAEIYIYDTLPGGAGFAKQVGDIGLSIFEEALRILEDCPDACDRSCYRCLRSYKNKFEHDLLDRHLGASLLRFILRDDPPMLNPRRVAHSTNLLFEGLDRLGIEGMNLRRDEVVMIAGLGDVTAPIFVTTATGAEFIIALQAPLTTGRAIAPELDEVERHGTALKVLRADELVVRRNLAAATKSLLQDLGATR